MIPIKSLSRALLALVFALVPIVVCAQGAAKETPASPPEPRFDIRRYVVEGATLVSTGDLEAATRPFTGPNRNFADVQRALECVVRR